MQHEIMMYGIAQKEGLGLDKRVTIHEPAPPFQLLTCSLDARAVFRAVEECKFRMSRYGVTCASWPRPAAFVAAGR
jgi:hypothetical protein